MKRILIFSLAYQPHMSGAEWAVKYITDRIAPSDIEFHMITLRFSTTDLAKEKVGNIQVHRVGGGRGYLSKILFVPRAVAKTFVLNRTLKFDAFWALMSYMLFPIVLLRFQGRGVRLPYVLTLQDGDPFEHVFGRPHIALLRPLLKYGFRHASVIQVISNFLAEWPRRFGYSGVTEVIPNGFEHWWFETDHSAQNKVQFWNNKQIPPTGVKLITTSRLVHKNAIDIVIRAMPLLPKNYDFVVLGQGVELKKLQRLAEDLKVAERVHFEGEIGNSQLVHWLHASDIFVRPSRSEGLGTSFLEAMAAGLPVIATQEGGIKDFLFDAKRNPEMPATGWAVDKDSPEQIAQAVKEILENPEATQRVIENAKRMVRERYDWDTIARDMRERVFARVLQ